MTDRRLPAGTTLCRPRRGARLLAAAGLLLAAVAIPLGIGAAPPALADDSEVTVPAPGGGTVRVEKTENLLNEVVGVSWEGFKPSENPIGPLFDEGQTRFPVRVYQCRGADPTRPEECYGSLIYDYPGRDSPGPDFDLATPDGPTNVVQIATAADGTGAVGIAMLTKRESVTLGCTEEVACSIVVVPNYGDKTRDDLHFPEFPACATIYDVTGSDCAAAPVLGNSIDAPWAWENRVVIPVTFASTGASCELSDAEAAVLGSPKAERAVTSWQSATCTAAEPVDFDYTSQGEGLARGAFLNSLTDVALTGRPVDPALITDDTRPFTYAPVATSAVAVVFRVDDAESGVQIADMKLNARLIAKLITQSYGYISWSPDGVDWGNPATRGNPVTIFADPEFLALNPGSSWPGTPTHSCSTPLLLADLSDMTYELTRYLAADEAAAAFLAGEEDEWGMQLNTNFADMTPYPVEAFELRDPDIDMAFAFQPIQGLNQVARKLVANSYAGTLSTMDGGSPPKPQKCGPYNRGVQPIGSRAFVAILDSASAAAFRFPVAAIANAGGEFVQPTEAAMTAAVGEMVVNADGITRSPNLGSTNREAYPLTTIDYAMVPTSGLDPATSEAVGRILDYAAGAGQQTGQLYGGLPAGFLPLGADLVVETVAAAAAVRAQDGGPPPSPTPTPTPTPSSSTSAPGTGAGNAPVVPAPPAAPGAPPAASAPGSSVVAAEPGEVATTTPAAAGPFRSIASHTPAWMGVILPVVLLAGLAAAGLGALASWLLGRGGITVPRIPWRRFTRRATSSSRPA